MALRAAHPQLSAPVSLPTAHLHSSFSYSVLRSSPPCPITVPVAPNSTFLGSKKVSDTPQSEYTPCK